MCDWWKPYCSHYGNMHVLLLWWVFAAFTTKQCAYDRCTTVFFLNRLRLELQTAPCEGIHRKVDKGLFRVILRNFDNDVYSDKRSRDLTNHKSSQGVGWPTTSTGRVRLHFPSPNEQTGAAMGGNGNLLLTGHLHYKDFLLKNLGSCWPTILIFQKAPGHFQVFLLYSRLPKTLITFQPGHAPALRIDFPSPIACSHNL